MNCGAAARTRLAATPNWKIPIAVLASVAALSLGVLAAAVVKLTGDSDSTTTAVVKTITTAPAAVIPPAASIPTPTTSVPATTTPGTSTPGTSTPGASTPSTSTPSTTGTSTPTTPTSPTTTAGKPKREFGLSGTQAERIRKLRKRAVPGAAAP